MNGNENTEAQRSWRGVLLRGVLEIATLVFGLTGALVVSPALAATGSNANSSLGINLQGVSYYTPEQPFLNIFKTSGGWSTDDAGGNDTGEEQYLNLDANGWPVSLAAVNDPNAQKFTKISTLLLRALPDTPNGNYPAGQYIVRYQGEGTIAYGLDATKVASLSAPGRDVIQVNSPSQEGIAITITSDDPNHTGDYIRNIQVVRADQEQALLAGQVFDPKFLSILKNFRVLRFMDWLQTNGNTLSSWTDRPLVASASWATSNGVPYEVTIELANALSADAWVNVPVMADDNYITQMATLYHNEMGNTQKVYVEFSNETWNTDFPQTKWINTQAQSAFPSVPSWLQNRVWYGMRTAQMCDIWHSVWGTDSNRVVCVLGAQAAVPATATESLDCQGWSGAPCWKHHIDAVAIAPYFGYQGVPSEFPSQSDGGLSSSITALLSQDDPSVPVGGYVGQSLGWVAAYHSALAKYNLPLIGYEGGQSFLSWPNGLNADGSNSALTNLYIALNRSTGMGTAYTDYLNGWRADGGQTFVLFNDVSTYSQHGEWGALESTMQTITPLSSAPPKWQAMQQFIASNPCWWPGCAGSVGTVPKTPMNFAAH